MNKVQINDRSMSTWSAYNRKIKPLNLAHHGSIFPNTPRGKTAKEFQNNLDNQVKALGKIATQNGRNFANENHDKITAYMMSNHSTLKN